MKNYPFHTAYTKARELYGIELKPDQFETLGLIAWDKIGNKKHRLYRYIANPLQNAEGTWYVDLPCNADILESITADYEDYQKTSPAHASGDSQSAWVEDYVESRKFNTSFMYSPGKFIKYFREDNRLYLADKFDTVSIVYKGVILDQDGLPSLNEKELDAIAVFCAYSILLKQGIMTRDANTINLSQMLEQKWKLMCTQARVPDYMNQNELDEVLNVATSWDRKRFGKSFKAVR